MRAARLAAFITLATSPAVAHAQSTETLPVVPVASDPNALPSDGSGIVVVTSPAEHLELMLVEPNRSRPSWSAFASQCATPCRMPNGNGRYTLLVRSRDDTFHISRALDLVAGRRTNVNVTIRRDRPLQSAIAWIGSATSLASTAIVIGMLRESAHCDPTGCGDPFWAGAISMVALSAIASTIGIVGIVMYVRAGSSIDVESVAPPRRAVSVHAIVTSIVSTGSITIRF